MNSYYLTLILKSDLKEEDRKVVLDSVIARLGKIQKEDLWGNRDLAYPIKKGKKGYYAHFEFETEPSEILNLDKALRLEEDIIRYLLIRQ